MIRELLTEDRLPECVEVIRKSFGTVAAEFGLTIDNCPTHPSFITIEKLNDLKKKGLKFFGCFVDDRLAGFIAAEKASGGLYYLEKLAVLPEYRHKSYGMRLVEFAVDYAAANGGEMISIGVIDGHSVLKEWYRGLGFLERTTRSYDNLPFTVCFMEKKL